MKRMGTGSRGYEISIARSGNYVKIQVFVAITGKMAREFAEKAIRNARQHNIKKFLINAHGSPNIATFYEQYVLGNEDMIHFGLNRSSKIAVLTDVNDNSHDFIETVFVNAGYQCCVFSDENDALKWLEV